MLHLRHGRRSDAGLAGRALQFHARRDLASADGRLHSVGERQAAGRTCRNRAGSLMMCAPTPALREKEERLLLPALGGLIVGALGLDPAAGCSVAEMLALPERR